MPTTKETFGRQYPEATDEYLTGLERVDAHKAPSEFAKGKPEGFRKYILDRVGESTRRIEEGRRALGYYASVCERLRDEHPDFYAQLTTDEQHMIDDMADRLTNNDRTGDTKTSELERYEEVKRELEGRLYVDRYAKGTALGGSAVIGIFGISESLKHGDTPLALGIGLGATALGYLGHRFANKVTREDIQEARSKFKAAREKLVQE